MTATMIAEKLDYEVRTNPSKNANLTEFGKDTLRDRYLLKHEDYQDLFARVATAYGDDCYHSQRLYEYMSDLWFMPATPILSNAGTKRGLPISCFLNEVEDSLSGIMDSWNENVWLASRGGGIGSYWGKVRSIGEKSGDSGGSSGIVPFIKVQDSLSLAISQGKLRRGSAAVYLPIDHPEIEEFIDLRRPTGDANRRSLNLNHGITISDAFMEAVEQDALWNLLSPKDGKVISTVKARDLWIKILTARVETGEPYIVFSDTVNRLAPEIYKRNGSIVKTSNLCAEIMLTTGKDYLNNYRTAVCCLSSLNLEYYEEWKDNKLFIEDIMRFLDNVLEDFIREAPESMANAKYSAYRERSVGLGVMGFHSFLQSKHLPLESATAKVWNKKIFQHIKTEADKASKILANERGAAPDAKDAGCHERFTHKTAVAPTASISVIAGGASPGIEPLFTNIYTQKTLNGSFSVRNKYLVRLLKEKNMDSEEVWSSIITNEGSVQHLNFLNEYERMIFKTAVEMDQNWLIDLAADRTPFIDQAQSLNIFLRGNIHKKQLHNLHYRAWKTGNKSLYYCRSLSIQRADKINNKIDNWSLATSPNAEPEECLACQ